MELDKSLTRVNPAKHSADNSIKENKKTLIKNIVVNETNTLKELLSKNDTKGFTKCADEVFDKMIKLSSCNDSLKERNIELLKEIEKVNNENKLLKDECHEKLKAANQENKMLRARNSTLQEEVTVAKNERDKTSNAAVSLAQLIDTVANLQDEDKLREVLVVQDDDDENCKKIKNLFKYCFKLRLVNDGSKFEVKDTKPYLPNTVIKVKTATKLKHSVALHFVPVNDENYLGIDEIEKVVGREVIGVKYKQGKGKSWKTLKVDEGKVHAPVTGWGDREYVVVTNDDAAVDVTAVHLGQGCVTTPGHSRRQENGEREGPMFPPHLTGPRICAE